MGWIRIIWEIAVDNNMHHVDDSSIIQRDSEELADMEDKQVKITEGDVEVLKQRLENANTLLQCYRDTIESIKYRGEVIFGDASYDGLPNAGIKKCEAFDHAAKATPSGKPAIELKPEHVTQTVLDQYIEDTWEIEENFAGLLEVKDAVDGNNPVLHNGTPWDDGNCTELDRWFHEKFPTNLEELAANLNMLSYLKQMMNQLAETVKGMEGYTNVYLEDTDIKGDFLPSGGRMVNTDDRFNKNEPDYIHDENALETQLESTEASAGDLFKDLNFATLVTEGRDNLYATMYIMNMFSYETSALEGLYELQGGGKDETDIYKMADGNKIKPGNAGTYYDDLLKKAPSTTEGDWWNTKKSFHPNKTLTNKMLDKDHCISYGNEVEYILYGDTRENNKTKIELTMALTRFAMNFAPVMDVYWDKSAVIDISNAIATATQGIIPAPLVRLIICMGVCAAESAVDMNYLKAGLPVAFYKSDAENQLFIDLTLDEVTMMKALENKSMDYVTKNMSVGERSITKSNAAFSYSDYVSVYLFIALCANEDAIYKRTADVIQLNMIENYPELGEYKLANAHTYFRIDANIRVKPLMLELPYAKMCGIEAPEDGAWNTLHSEAVRGY